MEYLLRENDPPDEFITYVLDNTEEIKEVEAFIECKQHGELKCFYKAVFFTSEGVRPHQACNNCKVKWSKPMWAEHSDITPRPRSQGSAWSV
jgi:hypothetical protein